MHITDIFIDIFQNLQDGIDDLEKRKKKEQRMKNRLTQNDDQSEGRLNKVICLL